MLPTEKIVAAREMCRARAVQQLTWQRKQVGRRGRTPVVPRAGNAMATIGLPELGCPTCAEKKSRIEGLPTF